MFTKKKTNKRLLIIALALVMVLSSATVAFASWTSFQNTAYNNGVITGTAPYTGQNPVPTDVITGLTPAAWSGIDVTPVINEEGGNPYAYILYSSTDTTRMAKVDVANKQTVSSWGGNSGIELMDTSQFSLSTPVISGDSLYVGVTRFEQMVDNPNFTDLSSWTVGGTGGTITANNKLIVQPLAEGSNVNMNITQQIPITSNGSQRLATKIRAHDVTNARVLFVLGNSMIHSVALTDDNPVIINKNLSIGGYSNVPLTVVFKYTAASADAYIEMDYLNYYQENSKIKVIDNISSSSAPAPYAMHDSNGEDLIFGGQLNTPVATDGTYLYFGTYNSNLGGKYYQVKKDGTEVNVFAPTGENFYWAGAAVMGNYVIFGGDSGKLYKRSISNFNSAGTEVQATSAGHIRSSICLKQFNNICFAFFTTTDGKLMRYVIPPDAYSPNSPVSTDIGYSTSTPVVSDNWNLYVGTNNGFANGTVKCFTNVHQNLPFTSAAVYNTAPVQASPVVYRSGTTDYVYFTTNTSNGQGYCLKKESGVNALTFQWATYQGGDGRYMLQGMASSSGYLVFGDDKANVYIVSPQ